MIICMILATLFGLLFIGLYMSAGPEVSEILLSCRCEKYEEEIKRCGLELQLLEGQLKKGRRNTYIRTEKKLKNKIKNASKMLKTYENRKVTGLDLIPLAGYRLLQLIRWDAGNSYIKQMYEKCQRFKEKKEAMNYTYYIFGNLFGNVLIGICLGFGLMGFVMASGNSTRAIMVGVIGFLLLFIMGYIPYDEVNQEINRRSEEIEQAFPQVVSQMTLLVVAGMEVSRAWKLSCLGGKTTLYSEMARVNLDLDNNVAPMEAYSRFITRCNNKYTTKLATAVMQNLSKGNSEIVNLFRQLNEESWLEYKHGARRMSERLQSKLFIPTMLMFVGILIMVIAPVLGGLSF